MESAGVSSGKSGASGVCLQFKRPLLIVIVGMVLITYFLSTLMEKRVYPIFKDGMETKDRIINTTEPERTAIGGYKKDVINKEKTASSPEYDVKFPYLNYDHFGMEWIGIVQEYEWSFKHLHGEDEFPKSHKPLEVGPDSFSETSIFKSKVTLHDKKTKYKKGDFIHVIIETKDEHGSKRLRGGDFLLGVMSNEISQKSTAGRTVDYGNGTYSMYFYAGWTGDAFINVTLYVTREAVLFYNNFRHREKRILWSAVFSDGNVSEKSNCTTTNGGHWNDKCSYGNIWSLGKTVLLCEKPESLACGTLASTSQDIQNLEMLAEAAVTIVDKEYLFEGNYRDATFSACPIKVQIEDSKKELKLPTCGPDLPVAMTSGYWLNNITFVPMMCKSQKWTPQLRLNCTSDKSFFFIGDSTLLQLNRVFNRKDIMGEIVKTVCKFFGLRTGFPVQKVEEVTFESDFIDKINVSLCRSYTPVIVFNFGFHYASWSVRAYIDRIYRTKFSVIRLFERCPNSIVIIKLAHPRDNNSVTQSVHSGNYLFYDMNRMLRRVFGGIGVRFLDLWDMVLSHPDKNTVHVAAHIIRQQFDMLFSYICPSMVK